MARRIGHPTTGMPPSAAGRPGPGTRPRRSGTSTSSCRSSPTSTGTNPAVRGRCTRRCASGSIAAWTASAWTSSTASARTRRCRTSRPSSPSIPDGGPHDDPRTHELLRAIRGCSTPTPGERVMVGEVVLPSTAGGAATTGTATSCTSPSTFRRSIAPWEAAGLARAHRPRSQHARAARRLADLGALEPRQPRATARVTAARRARAPPPCCCCPARHALPLRGRGARARGRAVPAPAWPRSRRTRRLPRADPVGSQPGHGWGHGPGCRGRPMRAPQRRPLRDEPARSCTSTAASRSAAGLAGPSSR